MGIQWGGKSFSKELWLTLCMGLLSSADYYHFLQKSFRVSMRPGSRSERADPGFLERGFILFEPVHEISNNVSF